MTKSMLEFFEIMLLFFPSKRDEYNEKMQDNFEGLDTIIVEDVFMPEVINLLKKNDDTSFLKSLFNYFEDVCVFADDYLLNVFSITVLEILGNDSKVLSVAKQYMGSVTTKLQYEADKALGRFIE